MVGGGTQGIPNSCVSDWLLIGCARVADRLPQSNQCEDRICGGTFNAEVSSMDKTVTSMYEIGWIYSCLRLVFIKLIINLR